MKLIMISEILDLNYYMSYCRVYNINDIYNIRRI